jgi:3-deoxy-D-manno-octulosonate 8-phosphate phosphatase (KDO 8-P phosphatase)
MTLISKLSDKLIKALGAIELVVFDFDGVFTDNMVWVSEDGTESVRCSRSDGIGLQKLEQLGIERMILSTETNPVVSTRSRKLKIRCIQACPEKLISLRIIAAEHDLPLSKIAFVGNDTNDLECLKNVGLPIVVRDSHEDVKPHSAYVTKCKGGHGAVREVCDMISCVHETIKQSKRENSQNRE